VLGVLDHREGRSRRAREGDAADEAVQRLGRAVGAGLGEMRHRQDCDARALGHLAQRFEHAANLAVFVAIGFPQVGRHRIDHHHGNISNVGDLAFEQIKVGL
jgi:hypothetical protein